MNIFLLNDQNKTKFIPEIHTLFVIYTKVFMDNHTCKHLWEMCFKQRKTKVKEKEYRNKTPL